MSTKRKIGASRGTGGSSMRMGCIRSALKRARCTMSGTLDTSLYGTALRTIPPPVGLRMVPWGLWSGTAGTVESSDRAQMELELWKQKKCKRRTKIKIHVAVGRSSKVEWKQDIYIRWLGPLVKAFIARNCRVLVRQSWRVIGRHPEPLRRSYRPLSGLEVSAMQLRWPMVTDVDRCRVRVSSLFPFGIASMQCILRVLDLKLEEKRMRNMRNEQARSGEMLRRNAAERASMVLDDQGGRRPTRIT
ncbi:hypothetical protein B0H13DRAFT_1978246 [Mycena leptocephala]|nr:hypothetical protein B0H13DRAFT_2079725 [Mycena leptocephala]KAJ7924388.1 hypothetical protein B0H13DRAFT_1978246 [Mycena leptocephala]